MKKYIAITASILTLSSSAFAFDMKSICVPTVDSSVSAGPTDGSINKINSLIFHNGGDNKTTVKLNVTGITMIDEANRKGESITEENYTVKSIRTGTMFELEGSPSNRFKFDSIFIQMGNLNATTVGPVSDGTFYQIISLGIIDSNSYYKNPTPMTVKKIVFDCKTTIRN